MENCNGNGNGCKSVGKSMAGKKKKANNEVVKKVMAEEKRRCDVVSSSSSHSSSMGLSNDSINGVLRIDYQCEDWWKWCRPGMLVDEQMSWGSIWYSFWEDNKDNVDDDASNNAFYGDVLEDDIWNLRSIQHIPQ